MASSSPCQRSDIPLSGSGCQWKPQLSMPGEASLARFLAVKITLFDDCYMQVIDDRGPCEWHSFTFGLTPTPKPRSEPKLHLRHWESCDANAKATEDPPCHDFEFFTKELVWSHQDIKTQEWRSYIANCKAFTFKRMIDLKTGQEELTYDVTRIGNTWYTIHNKVRKEIKVNIEIVPNPEFEFNETPAKILESLKKLDNPRRPKISEEKRKRRIRFYVADKSQLKKNSGHAFRALDGVCKEALESMEESEKMMLAQNAIGYTTSGVFYKWLNTDPKALASMHTILLNYLYPEDDTDGKDEETPSANWCCLPKHKGSDTPLRRMDEMSASKANSR